MVAPLTLPPLRQELGLFPAPPSGDGTPAWTLHDPAANKFFLVRWPVFELLSRWYLGSLQAVVEAVNRETTLSVSENDVLDVITFLEGNFLLDDTTSRASKRLATVKATSRPGWASWLLKNYLFIRIPLVRPQKFLDEMAPGVAWFFSGTFGFTVALATIAALFVVSRQWDAFLHSFNAYRSMGGMLAVGCAIPLAKIAHEFGHAFTAHRYGCRIPSMGIALVVMTPMLYTDTNEAWKLTSSRQRLAIGIAGIATELLLAIAALWAWIILPDGPARSAVFILATTTWIMTIVLNTSPFMRFDGYFILSDFLGIPNLHARSFAFGRWWLREKLFKLDEPPPEQFSRQRRRFMVLFALIVWIYRFSVFLGIALLVYHYFFKALGIFLFAVEIGWFIIHPLYKEARVWWRIRDRIHLSWITASNFLLLIGLVTIVVIPWRSRLIVPAVLSAIHEQQITAPLASMVTSEPAADKYEVRSGEILAQLTSPDMDHRIRQVRTSTDVSGWQVSRQVFDERLLSQGRVPQRRLEGGSTELFGLHGEKERLTLRAPFEGVIVARNDELAPGVWLSRKEPLYVVADTRQNRVDSYVSEREMDRIKPGAYARFIPDAAEFGDFECRVAEIDRVNIPVIEEPFLASTYGGPIAARNDSQGLPLPDSPLFRIRLHGCSPSGVPVFKLKGVTHIDADKRSLLLDWFSHAAAVLVRESGF